MIETSAYRDASGLSFEEGATSLLEKGQMTISGVQVKKVPSRQVKISMSSLQREKSSQGRV